ncbi:MAG: hypothetical protein SVS15_03355 [Thermodesulfobacteriota bacterium]|nr:hypothetical protein [Thermodesulfobacteriota bacterium]
MKGYLGLRIAVAVIATALGLIFVSPSFVSQGSFLRKLLPGDEVHLGLDLKGGVHLTLGVDIEKAVENTLARVGDDIRASAREEGIVVLRPNVTKDEELEFILLKTHDQERLETLLKDQFENMNVLVREPLEGEKIRYALSFSPDFRKYLARLTMDQAVKTIRNRIDQFGVAEPDIRRQQNNRIQVQLPGLDDPKRAVDVIGKTAHLEFKLVDEEADTAKAEKGIVPPGAELKDLLHRKPDGTYIRRPIVLKKHTS